MSELEQYNIVPKAKFVSQSLTQFIGKKTAFTFFTKLKHKNHLRFEASLLNF